MSGEEGEDIYPYQGQPVLPRTIVDELTRAVVDDDGRSDANCDDDDYFEGANSALTHGDDLGELDNGAEGLGDEAMGSESDENADENLPGTSREFGGGNDNASASNNIPSDSSGSSESLSSSDGASSQHSRERGSSRRGTQGRGRGVGRGHARGVGRGCACGVGRGRARGSGKGHARGAFTVGQTESCSWPLARICNQQT